MTPQVDQIVAAALELSPTARAFVAEKLIESLDADSDRELSEAWKREIEKRCLEIDRGQVELREAEAVFAKAFASLE